MLALHGLTQTIASIRSGAHAEHAEDKHGPAADETAWSAGFEFFRGVQEDAVRAALLGADVIWLLLPSSLKSAAVRLGPHIARV